MVVLLVWHKFLSVPTNLKRPISRMPGSITPLTLRLNPVCVKYNESSIYFNMFDWSCRSNLQSAVSVGLLSLPQPLGMFAYWYGVLAVSIAPLPSLVQVKELGNFYSLKERTVIYFSCFSPYFMNIGQYVGSSKRCKNLRQGPFKKKKIYSLIKFSDKISRKLWAAPCSVACDGRRWCHTQRVAMADLSAVQALRPHLRWLTDPKRRDPYSGSLCGVWHQWGFILSCRR